MLASSGTEIVALGGAVAAVVAAVGSAAAAVISAVNRRNLRPPSGGTIGEVVEQANHTVHANAASLQQVHERLNGEDALPRKEANG